MLAAQQLHQRVFTLHRSLLHTQAQGGHPQATVLQESTRHYLKDLILVTMTNLSCQVSHVKMGQFILAPKLAFTVICSTVRLDSNNSRFYRQVKTEHS